MTEKYNKTWQGELCRQIFKEDIIPCEDFDEALRYAAADVPETITNTAIRHYMYGMALYRKPLRTASVFLLHICAVPIVRSFCATV